MPAGFYYRTMHKPARIWPAAMKQIRKAAGLGKISPDFEMAGRSDEIVSDRRSVHYWRGAAGMSAALAARSGQRVILLEARPWLGGFFDYRVGRIDGHPLLPAGKGSGGTGRSGREYTSVYATLPWWGLTIII